MKKAISISIDTEQYRLHNLKNKNASEYINELLRKEFSQTNKETIYEQIRDKLIQDPVFRSKLSPNGGLHKGVDYFHPAEHSA